MKIAIIGAGAMGCLFGAGLSAVGHDVWLIDVMREHVDAIQKNGLCVEEKSEDGTYKEHVYKGLKAVTEPEKAGAADLTLIFVKSTVTAQAVCDNKAVFGPDTIAVTLQNGLGNIEAIDAAIGSGRLLAGTTSHGATMIAPGRVRHAGTGKTMLGELDGSISLRLERVVSTLNDAGFETQASDNVLGLLWDKLLVNVGINALTAITGLENGRLIELPELEAIMTLAIREGERVARAMGILLGDPDPAAHVRAVCSATAENRSSMLQDIQAGRRTEIDMINGAIVRAGALLGIDTPTNIVLTNLVRIRERSGGGQCWKP